MADVIRIRAAAVADATDLAALMASVQQLHVAARPDVFKQAAPSDLEAWAAHTITAGGPRVLIAEIAGTPVGYAVVMDGYRSENAFAFQRRWHEVEQLGVDPRHQRRGVARALLEHIAAAARAEGAAVELNTWSFNAAARAAFERLGFVAKNVRFELADD
jgi:ribosomal protein S18 acetylase RimI-like enzyme